MESRKLFSLALVLAAASNWLAAHAADPAKDYPNRPIRLIVSNAPGSSADTLTRIVAAKLGEALGQSIVADNRAGAGGAVGLEIAKHATPDGYTLITSGSALTIAPNLRKNLPYDPIKDFDYVVMYSRTPIVLVVNPGLPVKTVKDLIDYAKSRHGKINMASAGIGTQSHLNGTALMLAAGFESLHVPYKGGGPSMAAVVAGEAQWAIPPAGALMSLVKAGRLRALGHSLPQRSPLLGDMPAIAETVPGFKSVVISGFLAPKGTPKPIVEKLRATVAKVLDSQEVRDQFAFQGAEVSTGTSEDFRKAIQDEIAELGKLVKAIGLKAE
jgi:tripartite-type tricarboxylate transporter receptor subunit TctC